MMKRDLRRHLLWLVIVGLLTGCGGGGGTPAPAPAPRPFVPLVLPITIPTPAAVQMSDPSDFDTMKSDYETAEYDIRYNDVDLDGNVVPGTEGTDTHLARINAAAAYARGATGAGETIVVYDTGILESHQEFDDLGGTDKVTVVVRDSYRPTGAALFHGTIVSGVAAANRDGRQMHGVAFEAALSVVPLLLSDPPDPGAGQLYTPLAIDGYTVDDDRMDAELIGYPVSENLGSIINYSFGVAGAISQYDAALVREKLSFTAASLAQAGTADADKKIVVWAAGNAGSQITGDQDGDIATTDDQTRAVFDSPELLAGLGVVFTELQSHVLAVVALDQDGTIAGYSNHCGLAKNFCLAAPGSDIFAPFYAGTDRYIVRSGTSFAAPVVSGSLALLRHFFRNADGTYQLGNTELVTRLRFTANRQGIYADSDIYGSGLIDLDAATRPAGAMMTSVPWDPDARPVAGMGLDLAGGAFGARLSESLGAVEMVAFDQLGAPFPISLSQSLRPAARNGRLPRVLRTRQAWAPVGARTLARVEMTLASFSPAIDEALIAFPRGQAAFQAGTFGDMEAGWWLSWGRHDGRSLGLYRDGTTQAAAFADPSAFAAPWLALVQTGPGLGGVYPLSAGGRLGFALMGGAAHPEGFVPSAGAPGVGVLLEYRPAARAASWQTGLVAETDGFLGVRPSGALGTATATTAFAGVNHRWPVMAGWHALASGYMGWTRPAFHDAGLLRDATPLHSSTFSVGLERRSWWRSGDWLGFRVSQPLRTESGAADLRLATGRTKYGEVLYRTQRVDLAPAGRHLQVEAAWRGAFAVGELFLSLGVERHANQDVRQGLQLLGAVRFERVF